jgi:hypothetical protein
MKNCKSAQPHRTNRVPGAVITLEMVADIIPREFATRRKDFAKG